MNLHLHAKFIAVLLLLFQVAAPAGASGCPPTNVSRLWSAECFDTKNGVRTVKKEYRKNVLLQGRRSTSVVVTEPLELVSIGSTGSVRPSKYGDDSEFHFEPTDGQTGRFGYLTKNSDGKMISKCGYYRRDQFRVLVPPIYDQCDSFNDDRALVCVDCFSHCPSGDCHVSNFVGGKGYIINARNEIIESVDMPDLPFCSGKSRNISTEANCRAPATH